MDELVHHCRSPHEAQQGVFDREIPSKIKNKSTSFARSDQKQITHKNKSLVLPTESWKTKRSIARAQWRRSSIIFASCSEGVARGATMEQEDQPGSNDCHDSLPHCQIQHIGCFADQIRDNHIHWRQRRHTHQLNSLCDACLASKNFQEKWAMRAQNGEIFGQLGPTRHSERLRISRFPTGRRRCRQAIITHCGWTAPLTGGRFQ